MMHRHARATLNWPKQGQLKLLGQEHLLGLKYIPPVELVAIDLLNISMFTSSVLS